MKVHLMAPDVDFVVDAAATEIPSSVQDLVQDLQIDVLLDAMAEGDPLVRLAARTALLNPVSYPAAARYRQGVFADCEESPQFPRALYDIANRALAAERKAWWTTRSHPEMLLDSAVRVLTAQLTLIDELRDLVASRADGFASAGMRGFVATVRTELDDAYMVELRNRLDVLARREGVLFTAQLGTDGQVSHAVPRIPEMLGKLFPHLALTKPTFSYTLPDRDEAGFKALSRLRDQALWGAAYAADEAASHVHSFFEALRGEVGFYLGCMNLSRRLTELGAVVCAPEVLAAGTDTLHVDDLYDPCLVLRTGRVAVTNDVHMDGSRLLVVTGANHGGKTTLLRAIGVSQVLLGAGMSIPAKAARISLAPSVFTHWAREEDDTHEHGKLDEELSRMSSIVDGLVPGALLLSNESFASTNEAEGSQIALNLIRALVDSGIRVVAVTHMFDLADGLHSSGEPPAVFLRAERGHDGQRSYRLTPGPPLTTSFARDLYDREFGAVVSPEPVDPG